MDVRQDFSNIPALIQPGEAIMAKGGILPQRHVTRVPLGITHSFDEKTHTLMGISNWGWEVTNHELDYLWDPRD